MFCRWRWTISYNGSGTFQIDSSGQPVVASTTISVSVFNALTADLATGLSTAICKDGQTTTTAVIPFASGISVGQDTFNYYDVNSFTATLTGCTTSPTYTASVTRVGNVVTLELPQITATSNATTKTLTGMPAAFRPVTQKSFMTFCIDNGGANVTSLMQIETSGVITLYPTASGGNWTATGTMTCEAFSVTYTLV